MDRVAAQNCKGIAAWSITVPSVPLEGRYEKNAITYRLGFCKTHRAGNRKLTLYFKKPK